MQSSEDQTTARWLPHWASWIGLLWIGLGMVIGGETHAWLNLVGGLFLGYGVGKHG